MLKKIICILLVIICLIPAVAFAKSYSASDIYFGKVDIKAYTLKAGDKITGSSRVTVELYYADASGEVIERQNDGNIKSVVIDGEKVSEWKVVDISSAVMQVGNMLYMGAFGYTLKPTYAIEDEEGYFSLLPNTYHLYNANAKDKKVKFIGTAISKLGDFSIVSIADDANVAIKTDTMFEAEDRLLCKGTITDYIDYLGSSVPMVTCEEVTIRQYEPLQKGDKGEEVVQMKARLQELGYFRAGAELSDSYNDTCVERVQQFQKNNGLPATGDADVETLTILYSESAKPN